MSPRSAEFLKGANRRLEGARGALGSDPATALSAAYYAMLYAARGALSERDKYAKTHAGTWHLFREEFVDTEQFDAELATNAQAAQLKREQADYQAWAVPKAEAQEAINLAQRLLAAVEALIARMEEG